MIDNKRFSSLKDKLLRNIRIRKKLGRMFFLHIPKCGGTSVDWEFRRRFEWYSQKVSTLNPHASRIAAELTGVPLNEYRSAILAYDLARNDISYVSGHYTFSEAIWSEYNDKWPFVTILRDPVSQWYSQFFYNKYKPDSSHFRVDDSLEAFLVTERAEYVGRCYVDTLAGGPYSCLDGAIRQAEENLKKFSVVGTTERLSEFANRCEALVGCRLSFGHRNRNPAMGPNYVKDVSPELHSEVVKICHPNEKLYRFACSIHH